MVSVSSDGQKCVINKDGNQTLDFRELHFFVCSQFKNEYSHTKDMHLSPDPRPLVVVSLKELLMGKEEGQGVG